MKKLTLEQAVIISGYTGYLICPFAALHDEIEKRMGRGVFTHEMADPDTMAEIKLQFKDDFIAMAPE